MSAKPIVIADDHPLFRAALKQAIAAAAPDRDIVETASLAEARAAIGARPPGLVCLDLHMEDSDGFAGLLGLRHDFPALPVAVVSGSEGADVARRAMKFGAAAFIPKSLAIEEIRGAVAAVLDGGVWAPPAAPSAGEDTGLADKLAALTPTQLKVLISVHKGLLNKQIAYEMSISEATVKAHLTAIFRKLNVQTRTQAVIAAGALIAETGMVRDDG